MKCLFNLIRHKTIFSYPQRELFSKSKTHCSVCATGAFYILCHGRIYNLLFVLCSTHLTGSKFHRFRLLFDSLALIVRVTLDLWQHYCYYFLRWGTRKRKTLEISREKFSLKACPSSHHESGQKCFKLLSTMLHKPMSLTILSLKI